MVLSKLFGTKSDREVKKLAPTIGQINQMYESLSSKSDDELVVRTDELRDFVINTRQDTWYFQNYSAQNPIVRLKS